MPDEKPATRILHFGEAVEQRALCVLVEIDDDIAAKYDVKRPFHRPWIDQIQLFERYEPLEFGGRRAVARSSGDLREPTPDPFGRYAVEALCAIYALHGGLDHLRINIRGEKLDVPVGQVCERLAHDHGERIRLLTGRAARRPKTYTSRSGALALDLRQRLGGKMFEVVILAKERSEIRRDRVGQLLQL